MTESDNSVSSGNAAKIEIRQIRKITDRRFLNLYEMQYADKTGRVRNWVYASRQDPPKAETGAFDTIDAVIIVAYHEQREALVLIREFRMPLADFQYGFPAGLVDAGESVETCARRELAEETGLTVTGVRRVSPPIYSSSGLTDESIVMAYVSCTGAPSAANTGSAEDIETLFVSPESAGRLCEQSSEKVDVKTWLVLSHFSESRQI